MDEEGREGRIVNEAIPLSAINNMRSRYFGNGSNGVMRISRDERRVTEND